MKAEDKIYKAFYNQKEPSLYFSQLKELTGLSNSSLQNTLNKLIQNNIISINKTKSNTFYQIKDKKIFALRSAEISANKFKKLNRGVRLPLTELLKKLPNNIYTIILFGSASRNQEKENSDIDLLLVSEKKIDLEKIKKEIEIVSNHPLNIFNCNIQQLKKSDDHIIIQAKKTGFPIKGEQNYHEAILDEN